MKTKHSECKTCEVYYVEGYKFHEPDCHLEWENEMEICKVCGKLFPSEDDPTCCSTKCAEIRYATDENGLYLNDY